MRRLEAIVGPNTDFPDGIDLATFLEKHRNLISGRGLRALYVLSANQDKGKTLKFGVAGVQTGNPYGRLFEYVTFYGKTERETRNSNSCKGVILHYLGVTRYNRDVEAANSLVIQIENKLKQKFKVEIQDTGRGAERINTSSVSVKEIINEILRLQGEVVETITKNQRIARHKGVSRYRKETKAWKDSLTKEQEQKKAEQERRDQAIIQPDDRVIEVIGHYRRTKNGQTIYQMRWNRSWSYGTPESGFQTSDVGENTTKQIKDFYDTKQISKAQFDNIIEEISKYQIKWIADHPRARKPFNDK